MLEALLVRLIGETAVASVRALWRRLRRRPSATPARDEDAAERRGIVNDFGTGLGQAVMGVRDSVEAFERHGVLVDIHGVGDWTLIDALADPLYEARRVVDEVEARLARVHLEFGPDSPTGRAASGAVEELRDALARLHAYWTQPGEGDSFSHAERDAAREALERARGHQTEFVSRSREALR